MSAAHKNLLAVWAKEPKDLVAVEKALNELTKVLSASSDLNDKQSALASKDLYEISVLLAILKHDFETFDDYINQMHTYYTMAPENSENKHLMTGLHLMFLLAANRLSDFHMLLEQIPQKEQTSNAYISTPVRIEQSLMEGAYNKVVLTEKNIPSPFYTIFIRIMLDTIRREIATSIEKSFKVLTAKDATVMLLFDNDEQMKKFGQERKWHLDGERYVFEIEVAQEKPVNLDTVRVATQTLFYAKQLEQIV
ncbi:26S proteasome non-ATPase regulatory subunit 8 [Caenorhabditis elegans]|uniref:26S proteasome non-ATPase regulatory subunit 8 n=1 Tax=Caenorhabditis elegans TaxID=6239 RepID=PSMD8_CAEEL|nr:26S proteasome non-ATPase regulatory subunit 8 [Caenorhabditis elegans]Q23449.1 RecName: Full=26S proteasome non-ATPase regulatory subunit 8; AltName: Full=26S proteasome regulatory subunit rpn-12 [Caenorhabditis elegans]CAA93778.1 26S proteasome non-ATPase regulatory subunit 8 [Caenorhabditis elegans]|eukprot:NP_496489.1 26S proteasome non-ATPase regulatory subunit 8 [Caenorhabditis elegans]